MALVQIDLPMATTASLFLSHLPCNDAPLQRSKLFSDSNGYGSETIKHGVPIDLRMADHSEDCVLSFFGAKYSEAQMSNVQHLHIEMGA